MNFKTNVALIITLIKIIMLIMMLIVVVIHQRSNSLTDCNIYQEMLGFCHSIFICLERLSSTVVTRHVSIFVVLFIFFFYPGHPQPRSQFDWKTIKVLGQVS